MSAVANIVCLFLVATPLTFGHETFADKVNQAATTIESHYDIAKTYVDGIVSQIKLDAPLQSSSSFDQHKPSAECYKFLSDRIGTSRSRLIECSASNLDAATDQRDRLTRAFEESVALVRTHRCRLADRRGSNRIQRLWCKGTLATDLPTAVEKASVDFFTFAANARRVYYNWIVTAGRCMATSEEPSHEAEWRRACQNGQ